jgi:predicted S18 family serine protease
MKHDNERSNTKPLTIVLSVAAILVLIGVLVASYNISTAITGVQNDVGRLRQQVNLLGLPKSQASTATQPTAGTPSTAPDAGTPTALPSDGAVTQSIPIVAVSNDGNGVVGSLSLRMMQGTDQVLVSTEPFVEPDLQYSVNSAVQYAEHYTKSKGYDFIFNYKVDSQLIGGESAGAATTILTIAELEGKPLNNGVAITGTINADGSIGQIGGVVEKAKAVADAGYKYFLVPKGQSTVTYYQRKISRSGTASGPVYYEQDVPVTVDLASTAKQWGLTVIEVGSINDALPYFINQ